jgi:hypothetical protein
MVADGGAFQYRMASVSEKTGKRASASFTVHGRKMSREVSKTVTRLIRRRS